MATVEGAFKILDRASPALEKIHRKGEDVDRIMEKIGQRMDDFAAAAEKDMKIASDATDNYSRTTERTSTKVSASWEAMQRSVSKNVTQSEQAIAGLQTQLSTLDGQNVKPDIEVDVAPALAQIAILNKELDDLDRRSINVGSKTGGGAGIGSPFSKPQTQKVGFFRAAGKEMWGAAKNAMLRQGEREVEGLMGRILHRKQNPVEGIEDTEKAVRKFEKTASSASSAFGAMGGFVGKWVTVILSAGPALESVAGAVSGLVGSLGGGVLGAGAGLVGLMGTAVVGFGGFASVLLPTISNLKKSKTALDSYSKAIITYGKNSKQAEKAKGIFQKSGTQSTRQLLGVWGNTKNWWKKATKPGQESVTGMLKGLLQGGRKDFGHQFAGIANNASAAMDKGSTQFLSTLDSPNTHRNLSILSNTFDKLTPSVGNIFANMGRVFLNLSAAAKPQVIEFVKWLQKFMSGANQKTGNLDKMQGYFKEWTTDFKTWINFFKQLGGLAASFFGKGQKAGNSLLNEVSKQMREWREGIQKNPGGTENWIAEQTDNFKKLSREIGALVGSLGEMVNMLSNLIGPMTEVSKFVRESIGGGVAGSVLATAAGAGTYLGIRAAGKGLGRAAAGGLGKRMLGRGGIVGTIGEKLMGAGGWKEKGATPENPIWTKEVGGVAGGIASTAEGGVAGKGMGLASKVMLTATAVSIAAYGGVKLGDYLNKHVGPGGLTHQFAGNAAEANNYLLTGRKHPVHGNLGGSYLQAAGAAMPHQKYSPTQLQTAAAYGDLRYGKQGEALIKGKVSGKEWSEGVEAGVQSNSGQLSKTTESAWQRIQQGIKGPLHAMLSETTSAFGQIAKAAVGQLVKMGYSPSSASAIVSGLSSGSKGSREAIGMGPGMSQVKGHLDPHFTSKKAGGGIIPGTGMQDTVHFGGAKVAPGEAWIANRHHQDTFNKMLAPYGTNFNKVIEGDNRWHSSPKRSIRPDSGGILPGMQAGGRFAAGGNLGAMVGRANQLNSWGLPYLWGGGHGGFSQHPSGLDCSGSVSDVLHAGHLLSAPETSGSLASWGMPGPGPDLTVYANPEHTIMEMAGKFFGTSMSNPGGGPGWFPAPTAGYLAGFTARHMNVAGNAKIAKMLDMRAGSGGAGVQSIKLKSKGSKLGGIPGAMASKQMEGFGFGLEGLINKKLAKRGGKGVGGKASGKTYSGKVSWFNGGSTAGGKNTSEPGIAMNIAPGTESGWNNPTTQGWMRDSNAGHPDLARVTIAGHTANLPITDLGPAGFTQRAIDVTEGGVKKLGFSTGAFPTDAMGTASLLKQAGGPVAFGGWHAKGGRFRVNKPTLFGAGEAGEEEVHVTPKGKGGSGKGAGRGGPLVNIEHIHWHREGDIRRAIEVEFDKLGMHLQDHVDQEDELLV